eukprot:c33869_g1_i1.p1 GENE.c33869_g1_i1~~c33869_g1_i1.p1  ORF type:complete len:199 (+),score=31.88 c33869_g1_i1:138-734(+)
MRWIAIVCIVLYAIVLALQLFSIATRDWYGIKSGSNVTRYSLFYFCVKDVSPGASSGETCFRYDKAAKTEGITDNVHDGLQQLFNAGIVCGFSLALGTLEVLLSFLCTFFEFFADKKAGLSNCASRSGFVSTFFILFGPLFWWFYGIATNYQAVVPVRGFSHVKYGFWLPMVDIVLVVGAGLLLEFVGKSGNSVGSAV